MGDFNINLLKHDKHASTSEFLDLFYSHSFYPLITKPTRIHDNSATLIDNIFCNFSQMDNFVNGIMFTDISDHFPIFSVNKTQNVANCQKYHSCRSYTQFNYEKFQHEVNTFDWNKIYDFNDCQEAFTFFHTNFKNIHDQCFPLKQVKVGYSNRKPWLSRGLKNSIKMKNKLYLKYRNCGNENSYQIYKKYRNQLNSLLRKAEKEHFHNLLEKNKSNLKKSWSIIKDVINKKSSDHVNEKFIIDDKTETDKNVVVNSFNKFYTNLGKSLAKKYLKLVLTLCLI
jgi:hypothetical protein